MLLSPSVLLSAVVCAAPAPVPAQEDPALESLPPKEGQRFPALAFPTLQDGELRSIADFEGTKVLLIQFASW